LSERGGAVAPARRHQRHHVPGKGARRRLTVFALFSVLLATTPAIRQAYAGRRSASEEYRSLATALDEQLGTGLVY